MALVRNLPESVAVAMDVVTQDKARVFASHETAVSRDGVIFLMASVDAEFCGNSTSVSPTPRTDLVKRACTSPRNAAESRPSREWRLEMERPRLAERIRSSSTTAWESIPTGFVVGKPSILVSPSSSSVA